MPDEVNVGAATGSGSGDSGSTAGSSTPGSSSGGSSAAPVSDEQFLSAAHPAPAETTEAAKEAPKTDSTGADASKSAEEINLSALEPGQPEWLGKVTDAAAKAEIQKLLDYQKAVSARFKDQAELDAFFKELPGGKEQVAALQILSKEVGELDTHIAENKPEGNAIVAERYLSEAPDGGVGLFRAGAQHIAKTQPEAWAQLGREVVNESLKASGIGADFQTVIGAVQEMRQAIQNDDGEAFGKAASKLMGEPKADEKSSADPRLTRAQEAEKSARAAETKALGETWQSRDAKIGESFKTAVHQQIGTVFSKVLPKSVSEATRTELMGKVYTEVLGQVVSNEWTRAQITQLIGIANGADLSKANLRANQADFDKALELIKGAVNPDLLNRAVAKVVSAFAKERASSNAGAREAAKGGAERKDVGSGPATKPGYKPITEAEMADHGGRPMSDEELLAEYTKRRNAFA